MTRKNVEHNLVYSLYEDGVEEYGFGNGGGDHRMFLVARQAKEYHLRREEDGPKLDQDQYQYKLFQPDNITVEEYERMKADGWEFLDMSYAEFVDAIHESLVGYAD